MPYTFTHPGFSLPFKKWKSSLFSTTGLVFGSIAPDYDILLRWSNPRFHLFQYTIKEIILLIFPLAFFSGIYFHLIIRNVLIDRAPIALKKRLEPFRNFDFIQHIKKYFASIIFSIFFAIALHLFLDAISHWNASNFELYAEILFHLSWLSILCYYLAMYLPPVLFSIAGLYLTYTFVKREFPVRIKFNMLLEEQTKLFLILYFLIAFATAVLKISVSGLEKGFAIDSIVIGFTNGLLISFFITPALLLLHILKYG